MESNRSTDREARGEPLDVVFWLRPDEPADATGRCFAPAQRVGEILQAVAAALRQIPFGDVHGVAIRRITELAIDECAPLDGPVEARARAVGLQELTAGRHLVVIQCQLTNQFGDCFAAFSVETEATDDVPGDSAGSATTTVLPTPEPDLECVDNIPV